jgi:putative tryptophan/tyrosine transport system substrate-binding protein
MRRRNFIVLAGGIAGGGAFRPVAGRAQDSVRRIAVLLGLPQNDPEGLKWVKTFLDTLPSLGWKPDSNLRIDWRWAGDPAQMPALAKDVVGQKPDLIVATTTPMTAAVLSETRTIPVVFAVVSDPIGSGFVQSLSHPGGNATGFINIETSIGGKWLEILKEIAPGTTHVTAVFNPKTAPQSSYYLKSLENAAPAHGLTLSANPIGTIAELEAAINELAKQPNGGLVITPDTFTTFQANRELIISLTARLRIPAVYFLAIFVKSGGLVSYGVDNADLLRGAATYVARILKGETPANLPVQLPTKFELAINNKTAAALGVKFPSSIVVTADEVIE